MFVLGLILGLLFGKNLFAFYRLQRICHGGNHLQEAFRGSCNQARKSAKFIGKTRNLILFQARIVVENLRGGVVSRDITNGFDM
jgi:hypothetical protein